MPLSTLVLIAQIMFCRAFLKTSLEVPLVRLSSHNKANLKKLALRSNSVNKKKRSNQPSTKSSLLKTLLAH